MTRVFIVEDDATLSRLLVRTLTEWGYEALAAKDFARVDAECAAFSPHAILLDVTLPVRNGFAWCQTLRAQTDAPILFISSRAESMDIVTGVNMGGDDYIAKPFDIDVLLAKLRALLRRAGAEPQRLMARGVSYDPAAGVARVGAESVTLTKTEGRILCLLLEQKNRVVSRERIMLKVWDDDAFIDENTLTVNINRLRKKLEGAGDVIRTVKGAGYVIDDESVL